MGRTREDLIGGALGVLASLAFGGVTVLGKQLTDAGLSVPSLLAMRFGSASIILFAALAVSRQSLRPAPGEWLRLAGLGVLGYGIEATFFFLALGYGTVTAVTLLFFTYPVLVAVASMVLGRGMPGWLVGASLVAALAGTGIVVGSGGGLDVSTAGILLALASSLWFTGYLLGAEATLKRTPSLAGAAWVSGSASAGLVVYALVSGTAETPADLGDGLTVLGMGAGTAVAFAALFGSLRRLGAVRTAVVSATEPVAAAGLAIAFLGEPFRAATAIGGVLILAGAIGASVARGGAPEGEPPVP